MAYVNKLAHTRRGMRRISRVDRSKQKLIRLLGMIHSVRDREHHDDDDDGDTRVRLHRRDRIPRNLVSQERSHRESRMIWPSDIEWHPARNTQRHLLPTRASGREENTPTIGPARPGPVRSPAERRERSAFFTRLEYRRRRLSFSLHPE